MSQKKVLHNTADSIFKWTLINWSMLTEEEYKEYSRLKAPGMFHLEIKRCPNDQDFGSSWKQHENWLPLQYLKDFYVGKSL